MTSNDVALISIVSKFDEKSARVAAEKAGKTYDKAMRDIGKDTFENELVDQFNKAVKIVTGKLKNVNLSSYNANLLEVLFSNKEIDEKKKEIENFIGTISKINGALKGLPSNSFDNLSTAKLDQIVKQQEKIIENNKKISDERKSLNRSATSTANKNKKTSTIEKDYTIDTKKKAEISESLNSIISKNKDLNDSEKKNVDTLSRLLSLYDAMTKVTPEEGTKEAIRYSKDLLTVVKEIKETSEKVDLFTNKKASNYIKGAIDKKYLGDNLENVNDSYLVSRSKQNYVEKGLEPLTSKQAKLEKNLTEYISNAVQKSLEKITVTTEQVLDKAQKKVEILQDSIDSLNSKKTEKPIIDNLVDESEVKSLEDIEDRLYSIYDKDSSEGASNKELKEFISLYQQYEKKMASDSSSGMFDPELKEEYDMIVNTDEAMKKYAESINKVTEEKRELNTVTKSDEVENNTTKQVSEITELEKKLSDLSEKYEKLNNNSNFSDDFNLTENEEFQQLSKEIDNVKQEIDNLKGAISQLTYDTSSFDGFANDLEDKLKSVSDTVSNLVSDIDKLQDTLKTDNISLDESNISSASDSEIKTTTNDIIEEQKAIGELQIAFRGLEGSLNGFMSNSGRLATFFTTSPLLARQYADSLGGVYQAMVALGNSLNINAEGRDWNAVEYLGNGSDEASKKIIELRKQIDSLYEQLNASGVSGTGLDGRAEQIRGDFSHIIQFYGDAGIEYNSYIEAVEKGNIIENQENETVKNLMVQLYNLEKAYKAISDAKNNVYGTHTTDEFAELAKANGYDSVMFRNIKDSFDRTKNLTDVGVIFDENQVANVKNVSDQIDNLVSRIDGVKSQHGLNLPINIELPKEISKLEDGSFVNNLTGEIYSNAQTAIESLKELETQAIETEKVVENISSQTPSKDAFPDSSTNTKPETKSMEQVEKATEEAVQAKKEFATANEGVQSSIDGSENPLKLEAELMEQIAKSAREAADAKKEFVDANKQVKDSADASNSDLKAKPKKDKYAKRRKISEEDFLNYSPNRVNEKLSNSGYTILGETVNTEFVDGLVKVSAKIKDVDGAWKSFSAKVDADGNIFEQRFKTVTNGVDKLETALQNFGRETAPALTYQETLDKAQRIKNSLNLGDEYSIKVDSSEFVTITKKLTDVENAGSSVTQTFNSAQDAIDNFGKATSNSAEKTSVALKSVKSNVKEVVDETEKLANAQKEQNANVNLNGYDKRLDSYQGKINKYDTTIKRFEDGGWSSDTYLKNVQAVRDAVKQYATLLDNIKTNQNGIASDEDIQNLDKYEKKIKDTIATVTNMSASEKGYNFVSGQKELDKIHKLLNENSKMSSEAKAKIKAYYAEIESGNPSMSLDKIHGEIMKIYNAEVEAGRAGRSFFDTLKNSGFHQLAAQMAGMVGVYDVINVIKQAASTVTELNTQITELAKVSEQSSKQIYADFDSYSDIAKEVRGTISDTIAATADWSKNGYSIPDAKQLAEVSQLYKNVGDGIDIDTANESLISTLKGFQLEADQAEHIVDVFNEVSNNEAISSGGIGEALQRSAASFNAASTSLEKSVSLVTATNSVLQNPEKVGKQILAYLYSNVMKIKVAISVKPLRRARPRKDYNV